MRGRCSGLIKYCREKFRDSASWRQDVSITYQGKPYSTMLDTSGEDSLNLQIKLLTADVCLLVAHQ